MPKGNSDATCTGAIHLSLQGKGGVGKSLVASILAQYLIAQEKTRTRFDRADLIRGTGKKAQKVEIIRANKG